MWLSVFFMSMHMYESVCLADEQISDFDLEMYIYPEVFGIHNFIHQYLKVD